MYWKKKIKRKYPKNPQKKIREKNKKFTEKKIPEKIFFTKPFSNKNNVKKFS